MPIDQAYVKLRELLDIHPCGCPEAPEIYEILAILYSKAEARVAGGMTFVPRPAEVIAGKTAMDPREVRTHLESLADKGLVYARDKEGERGYALFPIMPGVFEFPLMRGEHNETTERLACLWRAYFPRLSQSFGSENMRFSRVIPIQEEVESVPGILTYEMLDRMIDAAKSVGIAHCACREANRKCDAPREACMLFDETCDFLVERGHGRYLSKEEMKRMLREFDEAGLVHQVNNAKDKLTFVCNCCPCCCGLLNAQLSFGNPHVFFGSGFIPQVDGDACNGCAICSEQRCPMGAIELIEEVASVDREKCIGCGLCVTGCPNQALGLVRRDAVPEPADTVRDMGIRILEDKGRMRDFLELNFG
jgi:electron transport complex protein RnfB